MKHLSAFILLFLICVSIALASDGVAKDSLKKAETYFDNSEIIWSGLGVGWGMDYGGVGLNYIFYVTRNVGLFAGAGYAWSGFGYNFGAKFRLIPKKEGAKLNPFILGMWGYHQAFTSDEPSLSLIKTGITAGIGTDYRANPESKGYWTVAILLPFKNEDEKYYKDWLDKNVIPQGGQYQTWVKGIGFSLGYHYIIRGRR